MKTIIEATHDRDIINKSSSSKFSDCSKAYAPSINQGDTSMMGVVDAKTHDDSN